MFIIAIADTVENLRERLQSGPRRSFWEELKTWSLLKITWRITKVILFIIILAIFIFILVYFAIPFITNLITQGSAQTALGEVQAGAETSGLLGFINRAYTTIAGVTERPNLYGTTWDEHVIKNPGEKTGVVIDEFQETRKTYKPDTEVVIRGKVSKLTNQNIELDQETNVVIGCLSEDYKGEIFTELSQRQDENIQPNSPQDYTFSLGTGRVSVNCLIPRGFELDAGKTTQSKLVSLAVDYKFTTDATLNLYFIDEQSLFKAQEARLNPFDFYNQGLNDKTLNKGLGLTQFNVQDAPVLIIGGVDGQPFEQDQNYFLEVSLKHADSFEWKGNIHLLEDLFITLPDNLEIIDEKSDFIPTEDSRALPLSSEVSFRAYKLKQEKLDEFNTICKSIFSDQECRNKYSNQQNFYKVTFKVTSIPELGGISLERIGARAYYTFRTTSTQSIILQNLENLNEDENKKA